MSHTLYHLSVATLYVRITLTKELDELDTKVKLNLFRVLSGAQAQADPGPTNDNASNQCNHVLCIIWICFKISHGFQCD